MSAPLGDSDYGIVMVNLIADEPAAELFDPMRTSVDAWSPDGTQLVTWTDEGVQLWAADTAALELTEQWSLSPIQQARWAPDGRHVLLSNNLSDAFLLDVGTGTVDAFPDVGTVSPTWSPGGRWLVLYKFDGGLELVDRDAPSPSVTIDSTCVDLADSRPFLGERGLICSDEDEAHHFVELGDEPPGDAVFLTDGLSSFSDDLVVLDEDRVAYSGSGPNGIGAYVATVTSSGLSDHQLLHPSACQVGRAGDRLYLLRNSGSTLFGVDIVSGPLPSPTQLGSNLAVEAISPDGRWIIERDRILDANDLGAVVSYDLSTDLGFSDRGIFAADGVGLFVREDDVWSFVRLEPGNVTKRQIVVSASDGHVQSRAALRLILFEEARVFEVEPDGDTLERTGLPCEGLTAFAMPQPPLGEPSEW